MDNKFLKENKIITSYFAIVIITLAALAVIKALNISYPLKVTTTASSGELAVVGEGKVDIVPNVANTDLGIVVNNASTVEDAQTQINNINNAIVAALKNLGIEDKDIKTSNYSIYPTYNYERNPNGEITGYSGNVTVSVKVRDTSKLPEVIAAGTEAGANQVIGTSYSVENPEEYREQARDKAIANAKEQAQKLASELGIRLGKVVNIVESSSDGGPMPFYGRASELSSSAGGGAAPDLQPGSQTISSTVTLYFEKR